MTVKDNFIAYLNKNFPDVQSQQITQLVSDQLISPHHLKLPQSVFMELKKQVQQTYALRKWSENNLSDEFEKLDLPKAKNYSVCNSFDYHLINNEIPKLIEVNTNAAFLALGVCLYDFWGVQPNTDFSFQKLIQTFKDEATALNLTDLKIAIMDQKPEEQRLYLEFLIYQQLFTQNNIPCSITDLKDVSQLSSGTLIYNRYTDFYLKDAVSVELKKLYQTGHVHLSPSPWEYFLMADKQRLSDWLTQTELPVPDSLLKIYDLALADKDQIWSERKNLFFKPKTSFGGKQAYKGASMSRKVFDEAFAQGFVAQEFAPPSEIEVIQDGVSTQFKYDLRCYTYKDEIQLVIARLYQGQTTNLKTIGGGFAIVIFE